MSKYWIGRNPNGETSDAWIQSLTGISQATLEFLSGSSSSNSTPNSFVQLDSNGDINLPGSSISTANTGTAEAGVSTAEYGDKYFHKTIITLTAKDMGSIAGSGAHAIGTKVYTFPSGGDIAIYDAILQVGITGAAAVAADTPDVGIGTAIGTGAVATLNLVGATAENVITGQTWTAKMAGVEQSAIVTNQPLILSAGTNALFMNAADSWAGASASNTVTGKIVVNWMFLV